MAKEILMGEFAPADQTNMDALDVFSHVNDTERNFETLKQAGKLAVAGTAVTLSAVALSNPEQVKEIVEGASQVVQSIAPAAKATKDLIHAGISIPLENEEIIGGLIVGGAAAAKELIQDRSVRNAPQIIGNFGLGFLFGAAAGNIVKDNSAGGLSSEQIKDYLTGPALFISGYGIYRTTIGNAQERAKRKKDNFDKTLNKIFYGYQDARLDGDAAKLEESKQELNRLVRGDDEAYGEYMKVFDTKVKERQQELREQARAMERASKR